MSSRPLLSDRAAKALARLYLLKPLQERHARLPDAGRADQAHALLAQPADVLRPRARLHVRDAVAMGAGEGVELDRRAIGLIDARVAAGTEHHCVIASGAKRSRAARAALDCFGAVRLAMTIITALPPSRRP